MNKDDNVKVKVIKMNEKVANKDRFLWYKNHRNEILYVLIGVLVGIVLMILFGNGGVIRLATNTKIATAGGKTYKADDYYQEMKKNTSIEALTGLIDYDLLLKKYPKQEKEAKEYGKEQADMYISQYTQMYQMQEDAVLKALGFESKDKFIEELTRQYYYEQCYNDYLADQVTDAEVKKFYDDYAFGERKVQLYSGSKKDLANVKKALETGSSMDDITKKYKNVKVNDLETLKFTDVVAYSDTFVKTLKGLTAKQVSAVFTDDTFGDSILYVTETKDMPKMDDVKDDIKKALGQTKGQADQDAYYKAMIALEKEYKIKFLDKELDKKYKEFIAQYEEKKEESNTQSK